MKGKGNKKLSLETWHCLGIWFTETKLKFATSPSTLDLLAHLQINRKHCLCVVYKH